MKELVNIQSELKAPKNQRNNFGGYNYRSAEDILEAVKPLLKKEKCTLTITDEVVMIGDRIYIKATTTLKNEKGDSETTSAYAREPLSKKGSDESQVTGAASSYARKYALNGLFCIDDTKDSDALNTNLEYTQPAAKPQAAAQSPAGKTQGAVQYKYNAMDATTASAFAAAKSNDDLLAIWNSASPALQNSADFRAAYTKRSNEIKGGK